MMPAVEITFDCLPLRSITRWDTPWDGGVQQKSLSNRIRRAVHQHGLLNTYYLHEGKCLFQLTNDPEIGAVEFSFEGTVLTDATDSRTRATFLETELVANSCDWLTAPVLRWLEETVTRAVLVEFNCYIASGDLHKAAERIERLESEVVTRGGFVSMGL